MTSKYTEDLRLLKSLLIVTSLQKRNDLKALEAIQEISLPIEWEPLDRLMIDQEVWGYAVSEKRYNPKIIFCHPDILLSNPITSLYYRGVSGLSLKAARNYFGTIDGLEAGRKGARLDKNKALRMTQTYNTFICSIIKNSTDWTLENGHRTIVATLGITLDGIMRNKVGAIAEERIRSLIVEWVTKQNLVATSTSGVGYLDDPLPKVFALKEGIVMSFSAEPDVSFQRETGNSRDLLAVVEIKGGIDPAGALERYGAATKSFQHAVKASSRCRNFYLAAVYTPELERRIEADRLVDKYFHIIEVLESSKTRDEFFMELFHHALRLL